MSGSSTRAVPASVREKLVRAIDIEHADEPWDSPWYLDGVSAWPAGDRGTLVETSVIIDATKTDGHPFEVLEAIAALVAQGALTMPWPADVCGYVLRYEAWGVTVAPGMRRGDFAPRLADDPRRVETKSFVVVDHAGGWTMLTRVRDDAGEPDVQSGTVLSAALGGRLVATMSRLGVLLGAYQRVSATGRAQ